MCRQNSYQLSDTYEGIPYPHKYLEIWLLCQRYRQPDGPPILPEPDKGPLDQDADLMLAFEVLEEISEDHRREEEMRQHNRELAKNMGYTM
jgi:hypothetical protein